MQRVHERLSLVAGVESVAGISLPPVNSILIPSVTVLAEGRPAPRTEAERSVLAAKYFLVTPNLFAALKAKLVRGREFTAHDTVSTPWAAVVNETMARRFWPGER